MGDRIVYTTRESKNIKQIKNLELSGYSELISLPTGYTIINLSFDLTLLEGTYSSSSFSGLLIGNKMIIPLNDGRYFVNGITGGFRFYSGSSAVEAKNRKIRFSNIMVTDGTETITSPVNYEPTGIIKQYRAVSNTISFINSISGNSIQAGTPTPETPRVIKSVGDYDSNTGKFKIPVKIGKKIYTCYLSEPLRKVGDYTDELLKADDGSFSVNRKCKSVQAENCTWVADESRLRTSIDDMLYVVGRHADFLAEEYSVNIAGVNNQMFHFAKNIYCYKTDLTVNPNGEIIYPLNQSQIDTNVSWDIAPTGSGNVIVLTEVTPSNTDATIRNYKSLVQTKEDEE